MCVHTKNADFQQLKRQAVNRVTSQPNMIHSMSNKLVKALRLCGTDHYLPAVEPPAGKVVARVVAGDLRGVGTRVNGLDSIRSFRYCARSRRACGSSLAGSSGVSVNSRLL